MSEFCIDCPMRGAVGSNVELEGVFGEQATFRYFGVESVKNVGVLADEAGNMSRPFYVGKCKNPEELVEGLADRLDSCSAAEQTFWGKLFRNENMVSCPALSKQKLDSREADRLLINLVKGTLWRDEGLPPRDIIKSRRFHPLSPDKG